MPSILGLCLFLLALELLFIFISATMSTIVSLSCRLLLHGPLCIQRLTAWPGLNTVVAIG